MDNPTYSVVVPVLDSGHVLEELCARLEATFAGPLPAAYEILLIDDGSTHPETAENLRRLARKPRVTVVRLSRNFGKAAAVLCGLSYARGDWIVTIDDDLQQRPEDIPALAEMRDHDVVVGIYERHHHPTLKRLSSVLKARFDRAILGYEFPISPLKLIRRHVAQGVLKVRTSQPYLPALIRQVTTDCVPVRVQQDASAVPRKRFGTRRRLRQFLNLLIGNSSLLMRSLAVVGLAFALASFALAAVILARKLVGVPVVPGWSSIMVVLLLVGGLNLTAIGLVGEYLIRILAAATHKPAYHVRDVLGRDDTPGDDPAA